MPITIDKPSKYFNTVLYTGTGSNLAVTGVGFKPDWVWCKSRSAAEDHTGWDAVRGSTKRLSQNTTGAEYVDAVQGMQSFDTDGFTCGVSNQYNASGQTQVSWCWLGANSTTSNTQGTITSTVSANTTSGFSIVTFSGNGVNGASVGHGLGVSPKMIILRRRDGAEDWICYHSALGNGYRIKLNLTVAAQADSAWYYTTPTSTVFNVAGYGAVNESGSSMVAYCFAEVKGFSKFGSYTGNGSTDGTFVYTGFKPAWVLMKVSSTTDGWLLMDNKRDVYNQVINQLEPSASNAASDNTARAMDFLSNGFKFRSTNTQNNQSGATYIYAAFAENPFVSSKGIPTTAR